LQAQFVFSFVHHLLIDHRGNDDDLVRAANADRKPT